MSTRYKRQTITHEPTNVQRRDLCTIREAAEILGTTVQNISQRANRGTFTIILDTQADSRQGRRLLLKSEIERARKG